MIIAVANPKGGVGKTKLATNIAVELYDRELRPKYIDGEKYGPNAEKLSKFDGRIPTYVAKTYDEILLAIQDNRRTADCVVLDLPGLDDATELFELCTPADLIIIPMQTSQVDLDQTKPFLKLIKAEQLRTGGAPETSLVFTYTRKNDRTARAYRRAMAPLGIPIAMTQIRRLDQYRDYTCVMRDPLLDEVEAATDVRALIDEIIWPKLSPLGSVGNG